MIGKTAKNGVTGEPDIRPALRETQFPRSGWPGSCFPETGRNRSLSFYPLAFIMLHHLFPDCGAKA